MKANRNRAIATLSGAALLAAMCSQAVCAQGLKTINNPGGGEIVYGPLTGQNTIAGAMGVVLRQVHSHFGDRPKVGRFFQVRGSSSVATFISLTAKNEGNKQIAGMVIVAMPAGTQPAAALLYDDANRFGKTLGPMLKTLAGAWRPSGERPRGERTTPQESQQNEAPFTHENGPNDQASQYLAGATHRGAAQHLEVAHAPDGSGLVGLPEGWQITGGGGGTIYAAGPHAEIMNLGVMYQNIFDPRYPGAQGMMSYLNAGHNPYYVCAFGGDLVKSYVTVAQQRLRFAGKPPSSLQVINVSQVPHSPYESAAELVLANVDLNDGNGSRISSVRIGVLGRPGPKGGWAMNVTAVLIPKQYASAEWPTLTAMMNSYRQNASVIAGQGRAIVDQINATAKANTILATARQQQNDSHNASVYKDWDTQAKYNKSFENYTLDRAVVKNTETDIHRTFDYNDASALVQSDPNKYEYVKTRDFLNGVDY